MPMLLSRVVASSRLGSVACGLLLSGLAFAQEEQSPLLQGEQLLLSGAYAAAKEVRREVKFFPEGHINADIELTRSFPF